MSYPFPKGWVAKLCLSVGTDVFLKMSYRMLRNASSLLFSIKGIKRAFRCCRHVPHDMGVNHGRFDILVSQKGLDFTDVDAVHEEMSGEAVPLMPSSA